ncbi:MAG: iron-containing alcohol dehydrogenase [Acidobacteria bacterium]|nr:MAG: iron-containing alcohol dehydrogenase [Acidobacteriota bacterium]
MTSQITDLFERAEELLREFKGERYIHGQGVLSRVGPAAASCGSRAVVVADRFPGSEPFLDVIRRSLADAGVAVVVEANGAAPNAPRDDLERITRELREYRPNVVVSFGGGSTIDTAKAAETLRTLGGGIEDYFGVGAVTGRLTQGGVQLTPHVAIQTAASSAAHLTKYSNITDILTSQKKLIVDEAIIPALPVFDYGVTLGCPWPLTADGALDGISHCLEVLYSAVGKPVYGKAEEIALTGIGLVLRHLPELKANQVAAKARDALGLATDLGGYAIMIGGTNGAHLTSFSLVDILSHGRACGLMNPYYTVLFAGVLERPLRAVGELYRREGFSSANLDHLHGRELGLAVATAMLDFARNMAFPTSLGEVPGFTDEHIRRALAAAKNPQLRMKLENMPIPMRAEDVDEFMGSVLWAAKEGDPARVSSFSF